MHEQQGNTGAPLSVFISYAHEDELWRQRLEAHLSLLRRQGLIADWHDRQIMPGAEWAQEIDEHLETAPITLLLISADFVASDYCYDKEMKRALERHQCGEARVIPIILRPCDWRSAPFGKLQCLPRDGKAVTEWDNQDAAFRDITQGLRRAIEQQPSVAPPVARLSALDRQNRLRLLKRVRATWIEGVLEHSLHQAALIALDLQEQPDALANPWQLAVQETNLPPRSLPAATSIVQVYDEADGELLILGEPGAGKTTLLLELTRALLERAEREERHRLPVVFNLSSWAQKRQPFADWLVEELSTKYQVPRKVGKGWIATDQILPLLDGLDEVAKDARSACVKAINAYYQDHLEKGAAPLVVCCRSEQYTALQTRVTLQQAVTIQPLTDVQIEAYLQSTKSQLEAMRQALHHDPGLNELAHRPLMLSIFTLAYQGAEVEELPSEGTRKVQQRHVFATYVKRMLNRRDILMQASRQQTLRWLTSLAAGMQQHDQTVFYLEYLQPEWLGGRRRRLPYQLTVGLLVGLGYGLIYALLIGLVFGLPCGLVFGLLAGLIRQIRPGEVLTWSLRKARRQTGRWLVVGLVGGLLIGLPAGLGYGLVYGLVVGLGYGLVYGLVSVLLIGLAQGLAGGISTNQLDEHLRLRPNRGIWRSARNGLSWGLSAMLFVGLLAGLGYGLVYGLPFLAFLLLSGLLYGLPFVLLVGLSIGLLAGLGAFFQHFMLRFWLWCTRRFPWNMVAFLDEADERLLLRKVGGGYIFIHRLLLDYFASLEKKES